MAVTDRVALQIEGAQRLARFLQDALELRAFFERSHLAMPEALASIFDEAPSRPREQLTLRMTMPRPPRPDAPPGVQDDWIWVDELEATVVTLVRSRLRGADGPLTPSKIFEAMPTGRTWNKGSIANLGTRLSEEKVISRTDDGWILTKPDKAPIAHGGFLWGPPIVPDVFQAYDVAAHRRFAIRHILGVSPDGMQVMQLTRTIAESCPWFNPGIPHNKYILKTDIEELEKAKLVRRKGHAKWELAKNEP